MLAQEISGALSRGVATDAFDENELEEELEAMQQESLDQKLLGAETAPTQPVRAPGKFTVASTNFTNNTLTSQLAAPVKAPQKTEEEEEEEELRRLQAEMA
jgi:charged multivesicular body protein 4A/B